MLLTLPAPPSAGCLREGPLYYEVTLLPSSTSYHQLLLAEGPSFHHPEKLSTTSGQTLFSHLHFWSQTAWIQIQHLPHTSCATLGESPHSSSEITFVDSFKAKMFFILWSEGDRSWQGFFPSVLIWTLETYSLLGNYSWQNKKPTILLWSSI